MVTIAYLVSSSSITTPGFSIVADKGSTDRSVITEISAGDTMQIGRTPVGCYINDCTHQSFHGIKIY